MAEKENLDIPMIVTVGIVSTVLTIASVIGVQALYLSYMARETDQKITFVPTADADSKLAEQDAKLAKYGWANRETGQAIVPIDRAMALVTADYANKTIFRIESEPRASHVGEQVPMRNELVSAKTTSAETAAEEVDDGSP